jgi:hypothetical protein
MLSRPSLRRTIIAAAIVGMGAIYTFAVKLNRGPDSFLASPWVAGVLPNFVVAAVLPVAIFWSSKVIHAGKDYLLFVGLILVGLVGYEFAQLAMPNRTFAWDDIWASVAGSGVAILLGFACFLRPDRS